MSFYDALRKPSWKGFEFSLDSEGKDFGRDVKKQKVINGEKVFYEDTGVKETVFSIEAVIGGADDFVQQMEEFERLLAAKGAGNLILPHEGEMLAVVTAARRRTASREIGVAYYSITFERLEKIQERSSASTSVGLRNQTDSTMNALLADFTNAYNGTVPDFVTSGSTNQMEAFTGKLSTALSRIRTNLNKPSFSMNDAKGFGQQIIDMFGGIANFSEPVNYAVSAPIVEESTKVNPLLLTKTLTGISSTAIADSAEVGQAGTLRAKNNTAMDLMVRGAAITSAANTVSYAEFSSKEEALAVRDELLNVMSSLRSSAGNQRWPASYKAIGSLMSAVNNDINTGLGRLPKTVTVKNQSVRSALELSYRLYGNQPTLVLAKSNDIINRNGIVHPSFVPAENVEVLVDA